MKKIIIINFLVIANLTIAYSQRISLPKTKNVINKTNDKVDKKIADKLDDKVDDTLNGKKDSNNNSSNNSSNSNAKAETKAPDNVDEISSPAKSYIKSFWKHFDKMKAHTDESNKQVVYKNCINGAETALKNAKMKDASYDVSDMEKALAEMQGMYGGVAGGKEDARELGRITSNKLLMFFEPSGPFIRFDYSSQETDAETIQRVKNNDDSLKKYKQLADKFLSEPYDKAWYEQRKSKVLSKAQSYQAPASSKEKWPAGLAVNMFHLEDPTSMWGIGTFTIIQNVKKEEAYFHAANAIYPDQPTIQKALEWCNKAVKQIGSVDDVLAKTKKDEKDYLNKVKFPAAKVNDASLEAEFRKIFDAQGWSEKITKVNIQSTDWVIDRNQLTGVIIGRSKQAFIGSQTNDGNCYVTEFWIFQDYNGSGYGNFRNGTGNSFRSKIVCEKIK